MSKTALLTPEEFEALDGDLLKLFEGDENVTGNVLDIFYNHNIFAIMEQPNVPKTKGPDDPFCYCEECSERMFAGLPKQ